jgi:hypothetical protein
LAIVLQTAAALVVPSGTVLVSEPPSGSGGTQRAGLSVGDIGFRDLGSLDGIRQFTMFHVEHRPNTD